MLNKDIELLRTFIEEKIEASQDLFEDGKYYDDNHKAEPYTKNEADELG